MSNISFTKVVKLPWQIPWLGVMMRQTCTCVIAKMGKGDSNKIVKSHSYVGFKSPFFFLGKVSSCLVETKIIHLKYSITRFFVIRNKIYS